MQQIFTIEIDIEEGGEMKNPMQQISQLKLTLREVREREKQTQCNNCVTSL